MRVTMVGYPTTAAWQRIEAWLRAHAPASYASLEAGASEGEISALEDTLGVRAPAGLKALWSLRAGVHDMRGAGFLLDDQTLMDLDAVAAFYLSSTEASVPSASSPDPSA